MSTTVDQAPGLARSNRESARAASRAGGQGFPPLTLPVGFTTVLGEIAPAPRSSVSSPASFARRSGARSTEAG